MLHAKLRESLDVVLFAAFAGALLLALLAMNGVEVRPADAADSGSLSISGHVRDGSANPILDVVVSAGGGGSANTDYNGSYTITNLAASTYTLAPSKSGYTFSPSSRAVSVPPDATGQDFTGSSSGGETFTISGRVTDGDGDALSGVTVLAGAGGEAVTGGDGQYTISGLVAGTYTLTPSKSGYIFTPFSRTASVPPSATGQDFVGSYALWRVYLPLVLRNS